MNSLIVPREEWVYSHEFIDRLEAALKVLGYQMQFEDSPLTHDINLDRSDRVNKVAEGVFLITRNTFNFLVNTLSRSLTIPTSGRFFQNPKATLDRLELDRAYKDILSLVLTLEGKIVIHGNILSHEPGEGFVILGESGKGKSTLSLELIKKGVQLISDDICAFDMRTLEVVFNTNTINICPITYKKLFSKSEVYNRKYKLNLEVSPCRQLENGIILKKFFKLTPHTGKEISIERVPPVKTVYELMKCAIIDPRVIGESIETYMQKRIEICSKVPLWNLFIPRKMAYLDRASRFLLKSA